MPELSEREKQLVKELKASKSVIFELLNKTWEFGGVHVGEKEYEGYDFVKDARKQMEDIDNLLWQLQ